MIGRLASPIHAMFGSSPPTGVQGRQEKNRDDNTNYNKNGCVGLSPPPPSHLFSSSSSSLSSAVDVVVADGEATIDTAEMGIKTALTECLNAVGSSPPTGVQGRQNKKRDDNNYYNKNGCVGLLPPPPRIYPPPPPPPYRRPLLSLWRTGRLPSIRRRWGSRPHSRSA